MKVTWITIFGLTTLLAQLSYALVLTKEVNQTETTSASGVAHRRKSNRDSSEESSGEYDSGDKADAVVLTLNTGDLLTSAKGEKPDVIDLVESALKYFVKTAPDFRSHFNGKPIKKNVVLHRNNKPSVVFEVNSDNIINTISKVLASRTFSKYAETLTHKVASMLRNLRQEFNEDE